MAGVDVNLISPIRLRILPGTLTILDAISVVANATPASLKVDPRPVDVYYEISVGVTTTPLALEFSLYSPAVDIYRSYTRATTDRRINRYAFQARLGKKMDKVSRKLMDNSILLSSHATDMIRVQATRDSRTGDLLARTVESYEVLPIMLPIMKDVPLRRLIKDSDEPILSFSSVDPGKTEPIEAYSPLGARLQRDDLLFRILDDPYAEQPYVMVLQVKDELGTLAYSSLLYVKYQLSFFDEKLPVAIVEEVVAAARKRDTLKW